MDDHVTLGDGVGPSESTVVDSRLDHGRPLGAGVLVGNVVDQTRWARPEQLVARGPLLDHQSPDVVGGGDRVGHGAGTHRDIVVTRLEGLTEFLCSNVVLLDGELLTLIFYAGEHISGRAFLNGLYLLYLIPDLNIVSGFEFTEVRDDGGTTFTITHAGGEPLTAENTGKVVAYGEIMARDVFSSVGEDTDPEPFEPGDTSTHAVDDTTVTLYWTPPGKTLDDMEGNLVTLTEESAPENL